MCCRETEDCPICAEAEESRDSHFKPATYTMFMTVLELANGDEPLFTTREGVDVWHQRRLMAVKASQAIDIERLIEAAENRNGTLRGTVVLMARDSQRTSSRIGKPVIMESGEAFEFMTEDDLAEAFGHDAVVQEGRTIREADTDITPFNYAEMFPRPTAALLAEEAGLSVRAGSQADIERSLQDGEEEEQPRTRRSRRTRQRDDDGEQEEAPARGRRARTRARSQGDEETADDERTEDREEEEREAQPRTRARTRSRPRAGAGSSGTGGSRKARTRRTGRAHDSVDDDEIPF
jgi:hypothetical protein